MSFRFVNRLKDKKRILESKNEKLQCEFFKQKRNRREHQWEIFCSLILLGTFVFNSTVEARDLVQAAATAQTILNRIGIAAISIGITLGGILYVIGAAQLGRQILFGGMIGAVCILAAPSMVNLLGTVFGGGVS